MAEKKIKKRTSVKRFGVRYGRRIKDKLAKVEKERKKKHECIFCNKKKVKRIAAGIWYCSKCKAKFASGSYTVTKKLTMRSMKDMVETAPKEQTESEQNE